MTEMPEYVSSVSKGCSLPSESTRTATQPSSKPIPSTEISSPVLAPEGILSPVTGISAGRISIVPSSSCPDLTIYVPGVSDDGTRKTRPDAVTTVTSTSYEVPSWLTMLMAGSSGKPFHCTSTSPPARAEAGSTHSDKGFSAWGPESPSLSLHATAKKTRSSRVNIFLIVLYLQDFSESPLSPLQKGGTCRC